MTKERSEDYYYECIMDVLPRLSCSLSKTSAWVIHSIYPFRSSSNCWVSLSFWNSPRDFAFSRSFVNSLMENKAISTEAFKNGHEMVETREGMEMENMEPYPLSTPRIRLSTKKEPTRMSVVKKIQGHSIPIASFTCQIINVTIHWIKMFI